MRLVPGLSLAVILIVVTLNSTKGSNPLQVFFIARLTYNLKRRILSVVYQGYLNISSKRSKVVLSADNQQNSASISSLDLHACVQQRNKIESQTVSIRFFFISLKDKYSYSTMNLSVSYVKLEPFSRN